MIPLNFLPPLPVEPLKKQVRPPKLRHVYRLLKELFIVLGLSGVTISAFYGAYNIAYPPTPKPIPPSINYSGYITGKVAMYPDATRSYGGYFTNGNTLIGDASSDTVTINGNLRVNGTITTDSKVSKCQN